MNTATKLPLVLTLLLTVTALGACGGSSSDSDEPTPPTSNGNGGGTTNGNGDNDIDESDDDPGNDEDNTNGSDNPVSAESWAPVHPLPQGYNLNVVISDATQFVAGGNRGTILTSSNGTDWDVQTIGSADIAAIAHNGSRFVAVGGTGNNNDVGGQIYISDNGSDWSAVETDFSTGQLNAVTWAGNEFIAMGNQVGTLLRSETGSSWTKADTGPDMRVISLSANNSTLVAGGTHALHRSTDGGASWTRVLNYQSQANSSFNGLLYDGSQFVAVGPHNMYGLTYSENGSSWSNRAEDFEYAFFNNPQRNFQDVIRVGEHYWVINSTGFVHKRDIGGDEAWSTQSERTSESLASIAHLDGVFLAVGQQGVLYRSEDGDDWSDQRSLAFELEGSDSLLAMAANDDRLVIVGNRTIITTTDGENWNRVELDEAHGLADVLWTGTRFVVAGINVVGHSLDGLDWTFDTSVQGAFSTVTGTDDEWAAVNGSAFQGDQLVLCTTAGCDSKEAPLSNIRSIARVGSTYVIANNTGWVNSSTDLETWGQAQRPFTTAASLLASNGDVAVLASPNDIRDKAFYSTDGTTWAPISFPAEASVGSSRLFFDGEYFRLYGGSSLLSSTDGSQWHPTSLTPNLRDMTRLGDEHYLINNSNHIFKR